MGLHKCNDRSNAHEQHMVGGGHGHRQQQVQKGSVDCLQSCPC